MAEIFKCVILIFVFYFACYFTGFAADDKAAKGTDDDHDDHKTSYSTGTLSDDLPNYRDINFNNAKVIQLWQQVIEETMFTDKQLRVLGEQIPSKTQQEKIKNAKEYKHLDNRVYKLWDIVQRESIEDTDDEEMQRIIKGYTTFQKYINEIIHWEKYVVDYLANPIPKDDERWYNSTRTYNKALEQVGESSKGAKEYLYTLGYTVYKIKTGTD